MNRFRSYVFRVDRVHSLAGLMFSRTPHTNGFRLPRWTGFLLAVVLAPFVAGTSQASCGNYVHIAPTPQTQAQNTENQPIAAQVSDSHNRPVTPGPGGPCQGPNCSRQRESMPPMPSPPPTVQSVDHSALLAISPAILTDEGGRQLLDPVSLPSSTSSFRLERPPRS